MLGKNKLHRFFIAAGNNLEKYFPFLQSNLEKAKIKQKPSEFIAASLKKSSYIFIIIFIVMLVVLISIDLTPLVLLFLILSIVISAVFFIMKVSSIQKIAKIRTMSIESNLIYALRHLQIQLSAGISIRNAISSIAEGNYGEVSEIFSKAVEEISLGKPIIRVFEGIALTTTSESLRKSMSLMINSLSTGGSVSDALNSYIESFSVEQQNQIMGYGGVLKNMVVFFIMFGAMIPTMGATMIVAVMSLTGIDNTTVISFLVGLELFALLFIFLLLGRIKSKRPAVLENY